jgi:hypothetical protein
VLSRRELLKLGFSGEGSRSRKEERSAFVEDNVVPDTLNNVSMGF